MDRKELILLFCSLLLIVSTRSENSTETESYCNLNAENSAINHKIISCTPSSDVIINQGQDVLCIYLKNQNGQYANTSVEVDGVKSIGLVRI